MSIDGGFMVVCNKLSPIAYVTSYYASSILSPYASFFVEVVWINPPLQAFFILFFFIIS